MALRKQPAEEDDPKRKQYREAALPMEEGHSSGIFDLDVAMASTWE